MLCVPSILMPLFDVMNAVYIQGKPFEKTDFKITKLEKGEYENCDFTTCNFSATDLADLKFINCTFNNCNLSLAALKQTAFIDVRFQGCKMLGLRFDHCNEFALSFTTENCTLDHSSFYGRKLRKTKFINTQFHEVDFTDADFTAAIFDNCDFTNARFENTILEKADFRTASNYAINPEINRIKKAKFTLPSVIGLLTKYDIIIEL